RSIDLHRARPVPRRLAETGTVQVAEAAAHHRCGPGHSSPMILPTTRSFGTNPQARNEAERHVSHPDTTPALFRTARWRPHTVDPRIRSLRGGSRRHETPAPAALLATQRRAADRRSPEPVSGPPPASRSPAGTRPAAPPIASRRRYARTLAARSDTLQSHPH